MDGGLWVNWPGSSVSPASTEDQQRKQHEQAEKSLSALKDFFSQARAYDELSEPAVQNLRFEAVKGIFTGKKSLFIRASRAKDILAQVTWGRSVHVIPVLVGADETPLVAGFLTEKKV